MQNPHNLLVAAKARGLAVATFRATDTFPRAELFGLTAQMRRAAVSVGANIFEGCGRSGDKELLSFLRIAMGSVTELEFHCLLARDLAFGQADDLEIMSSMIIELKKMLARLIVGIERPKRQRSAASRT